MVLLPTLNQCYNQDNTMPMKIINIISKLPKWIKSNGTMNKSSMDTVVVHHDGENRPLIYNSINRYISEAKYHMSKGWSHISYHYIIDNAGTVFQCLPDTEVGYHAGNLIVNKKSIAIKFDGNMEVQKLTNSQITAYNELIKYLTTQRPDLPKITKKSIIMHREVPNKETACPGKNTVQTVINSIK